MVVTIEKETETLHNIKYTDYMADYLKPKKKTSYSGNSGKEYVVLMEDQNE